MKTEKYIRGEALRVLWKDSTQSGGWHYADEPSVHIEEVVSTGFFVNASKDGINISTTLSDAGGVLSYVSIPWVAIEKIERLDRWGRYDDLGDPEDSLSIEI